MSWLVHLGDFCWVFVVCFGLVLYGNMMAFTYLNKRKRGDILPTLVLHKLYTLWSPILSLNFLENICSKFLHVLFVALAYIFLEKIVIGR